MSLDAALSPQAGPDPGLSSSSGVFQELTRLAFRASGRETVPVQAPFTGEMLGELPVCTAADVADAATTARVAQQAWAEVPARDRCSLLDRFHDLLLDRMDEILDIVQLETGKARRHAFEEVVDAATTTAYYARRSPWLLRPQRRAGAVPLLTRVREHRHPHGVVGMIIPWNYPLALAVTDTVPALAAGNAVLLKPDLQTSFCALWVLDRFREAGLPPGVLQVVTGDGPVTGGAVTDLADYVSFTGSTATGRIVARRAGQRLIGSSLELGGKNPMIVRADADLGRALSGAIRGCFANAGQLCISIERLLVHTAIYDAFLEEFAARTRRLRLGAGLDYEADVGSLTTERQLRKVESHVRDAVDKGATVEAGGKARPDVGPFFFEPTVLTGITPEMTLYAEETFGPVVAVRPFRDDTEAVALANEGCFGLSASIWTRDTRRGERLATRVLAGTVNVNEAYSAGWGSLDAPMGGVRDSGVGRRHGREGLLKFTEPQTIAVQRGVPLDLSGRQFSRPGQRRVVRAVLKVLRVLRYRG